MKHLRSAFALSLLTLTLGAGCQPPEYSFELAITVAPEVTLEDGQALLFVVAPDSGGIELASEVGVEALSIESDTTQYTGAEPECCLRGTTYSFYAFIDRDGSGDWNAGEPWGPDASNPVAISGDGYQVDILVDVDPG